MLLAIHRIFKHYVIVVVSLVFLVACGGSDTTQSPPPIDTKAPVITLNGSSTVSLNQGEIYTELGATAMDDTDGSVAVTISGTVDTAIAAVYVITYSATDTAGNTSSEIRTVTVVNVVDITAPVITLNGSSRVSLNQGEIYTELGATAMDDTDGSVAVTISGTVDTNTIGVYTIEYSAIDSANNSSTISRVITITPQGAFVTTWKTDNLNIECDDDYYQDDTRIKITTNSQFSYDYDIDWGDGSSEKNVTGDIVHTYASPGIYTVSITGNFPHFYSQSADSIWSGYSCAKRKLISIEQWGDIKWQSMYSAFYEHTAFILNAEDEPDLSSVTDMSFMFAGADSFIGDISGWDVSSVTNMSSMFRETRKFNQDLSSWDVSSVTNMSSMFDGAHVFNQDISRWDVSSVTDMSSMFSWAVAFNQDINRWDVSSVTNMNGMFRNASDFNQDLSSWDVSSVTDMSYMFGGAFVFNQDISSWDVSSATNMSAMFSSAESFNGEIGDWDVSSVTDMSWMFSSTESFNGEIGDWDVSSVTDMSSMFFNAISFNAYIGNWDVSSVTDMSSMFFNAISFNAYIGNWDVSAVTDMSGMFSSVEAFNGEIGNWDVSSVTDMSSMFESAESFNGEIGSWDVSSVDRMQAMFMEASSFNRDIGSWDVSSVRDMEAMFYNAIYFNQDLGGWDVSSVGSVSWGGMSNMFRGAKLSTENYDSLLIGWSTQNLQDNIRFHAGSSKYSEEAQSARNILTDVYYWDITDGGK